MSRSWFLMLAAFCSCSLAGAQEGPSKEEYFGQNGKLYSVERSGSDAVKRFLLYRRPISGEDGLYYDGKIRTTTDILGGGFTTEEIKFFSTCSSADGELVVLLGAGEKRQEFKIKTGRGAPSRQSMNAHNLWWATCKGEFRKFR